MGVQVFLPYITLKCVLTAKCNDSKAVALSEVCFPYESVFHTVVLPADRLIIYQEILEILLNMLHKLARERLQHTD